MKYKDLDGNEVSWRPKSKPRENSSQNHQKALADLKDLLPNTYIYQECNIPVGKNLYLDIFIPGLGVAIEVDGRQHDEYNGFFHKDQMAYLKAKYNDHIKEEWCAINNILLIRLKEKNKNEWREEIALGIGGGKN